MSRKCGTTLVRSSAFLTKKGAAYGDEQEERLRTSASRRLGRIHQRLRKTGPAPLASCLMRACVRAYVRVEQEESSGEASLTGYASARHRREGDGAPPPPPPDNLTPIFDRTHVCSHRHACSPSSSPLSPSLSLLPSSSRSIVTRSIFLPTKCVLVGEQREEKAKAIIAKKRDQMAAELRKHQCVPPLLPSQITSPHRLPLLPSPLTLTTTSPHRPPTLTDHLYSPHLPP